MAETAVVPRAYKEEVWEERISRFGHLDREDLAVPVASLRRRRLTRIKFGCRRACRCIQK
jgi:hypothetical protein